MVVSFVKTEFFQKEGTTWILFIFRFLSCIVEWSCSLACGQSVPQMAIKWFGTYYRRILVKFTRNNSIWCWRNLFGSCHNNFVIQKGTLAAKSTSKTWKSSPCRCCPDIWESIMMFAGFAHLFWWVVIWTWILSIGGMILKGQDWKNRRKSRPSAPPSTNMHRPGTELAPSLCAVSD